MTNPKVKTCQLQGACKCMEVTYEVTDEFIFAVNCHCSICRRTTGSAFKPLAGIEYEKLKITKGKGSMRAFPSDTWTDFRCHLCGSFLFATVQDGTFAHVAMGTLIDEPGIRPMAHVFVGSKAGWYDISDNLPQFDQALPYDWSPAASAAKDHAIPLAAPQKHKTRKF